MKNSSKSLKKIPLVSQTYRIVKSSMEAFHRLRYPTISKQEFVTELKRAIGITIDLGGHHQIVFGVLGQRWQNWQTWQEKIFNNSWVNVPIRHLQKRISNPYPV